MYIVKEGKALCTAKGIVGAPIDPKNPTQKELITVEHFRNGEKGLNDLLKSESCPIKKFEKDTDIDVNKELKNLKEKIDTKEALEKIEKEEIEKQKPIAQGAQRKNK